HVGQLLHGRELDVSTFHEAPTLDPNGRWPVHHYLVDRRVLHQLLEGPKPDGARQHALDEQLVLLVIQRSRLLLNQSCDPVSKRLRLGLPPVGPGRLVHEPAAQSACELVHRAHRPKPAAETSTAPSFRRSPAGLGTRRSSRAKLCAAVSSTACRSETRSAAVALSEDGENATTSAS